MDNKNEQATRILQAAVEKDMTELSKEVSYLAYT